MNKLWVNIHTHIYMYIYIYHDITRRICEEGTKRGEGEGETGVET